jgi:hypothetical protein
MHQRCTLILRSLCVEFSPDIGIYTAEKLLIVPETILVLLNRIFEIENSCVGTENDACRVIAEKLERVMRPFVAAEGSAEIDKVKEILRDGSGLNFNGH